MAKIKNIGPGPRGFFDDQMNHIILQSQEEREFNMSENDYKKLKEIIEAEGDNPTIELSGSHGGVSPAKPAKKDDDDERPTGRGRTRDDK